MEKSLREGGNKVNIIAILVLLAIVIYTFGFAVTLWNGKQKMAALAVMFLSLAIIVLPFFSIL
jgi:hypothetical protein